MIQFLRRFQETFFWHIDHSHNNAIDIISTSNTHWLLPARMWQSFLLQGCKREQEEEEGWGLLSVSLEWQSHLWSLPHSNATWNTSSDKSYHKTCINKSCGIFCLSNYILWLSMIIFLDLLFLNIIFGAEIPEVKISVFL